MRLPTSKSLLGRALRLPLRVVPKRAVVRVIAGPARGMRWVVGSTDHGAWLGVQERARLAGFCERVHPGAVVWDIGANVGLYTLPVARLAADGVRVVAFEPVPRNLEYLRRHLALNRLETGVRVVAAAAGDVAGTMRFTAGSGPSQGRLDPGGETEVPCIVLDAWRRTEGEPPPSLVKMDVEGGEAAVLRGAAEVFQSARPTLFLSIHGDEPRRECGALLRSWGYAITSLESGVPVERSMEWLAEAE